MTKVVWFLIVAACASMLAATFTHGNLRGGFVSATLVLAMAGAVLMYHVDRRRS